jgi:hypothetical protein
VDIPSDIILVSNSVNIDHLFQKLKRKATHRHHDPNIGPFSVREEVGLKIETHESDYDTIMKMFFAAHVVSVDDYEN